MLPPLPRPSTFLLFLCFLQIRKKRRHLLFLTCRILSLCLRAHPFSFPRRPWERRLGKQNLDLFRSHSDQSFSERPCPPLPPRPSLLLLLLHHLRKSKETLRRPPPCPTCRRRHLLRLRTPLASSPRRPWERRWWSHPVILSHSLRSICLGSRLRPPTLPRPP